MIPLPDWNRLHPPRTPRSGGGAGAGCSDFSGCTLGCGATLAVVVLTLVAARTYGVWAGLGTLAALLFLTERLARAPRLVPGLLLGALAAAAVWRTMLRDYASQPGLMAFDASLAFLLFALAGYLDQRLRNRS